MVTVCGIFYECKALELKLPGDPLVAGVGARFASLPVENTVGAWANAGDDAGVAGCPGTGAADVVIFKPFQRSEQFVFQKPIFSLSRS